MQRYVKLLSATPTETLELIVSPERQELQRQLSGLGEDGASEKCFIEAALEELKACARYIFYTKALYWGAPELITVAPIPFTCMCT